MRRVWLFARLDDATAAAASACGAWNGFHTNSLELQADSHSKQRQSDESLYSSCSGRDERWDAPDAMHLRAQEHCGVATALQRIVPPMPCIQTHNVGAHADAAVSDVAAEKAARESSPGTKTWSPAPVVARLMKAAAGHPSRRRPVVLAQSARTQATPEQNPLRNATDCTYYALCAHPALYPDGGRRRA